MKWAHRLRHSLLPSGCMGSDPYANMAEGYMNNREHRANAIDACRPCATICASLCRNPSYARVIEAFGLTMLRPLFLIAVAAALAGQSVPSSAFQEQSLGGGTGPPGSSAPASSLDLSIPDPGAGRSTGTEVRIPGVGTVGVLPKLDFGLELLYGNNDSPASRFDERSQPSDVQLRATIK